MQCHIVIKCQRWLVSSTKMSVTFSRLWAGVVWSSLRGARWGAWGRHPVTIGPTLAWTDTGHDHAMCTQRTHQTDTGHDHAMCTQRTHQTDTGHDHAMCTQRTHQTDTGHAHAMCTQRTHQTDTGHDHAMCTQRTHQTDTGHDHAMCTQRTHQTDTGHDHAMCTQRTHQTDTGHDHAMCTQRTHQTDTGHDHAMCTQRTHQTDTGHDHAMCTQRTHQTDTGHDHAMCTQRTHQTDTGHAHAMCTQRTHQTNQMRYCNWSSDYFVFDSGVQLYRKWYYVLIFRTIRGHMTWLYGRKMHWVKPGLQVQLILVNFLRLFRRSAVCDRRLAESPTSAAARTTGFTIAAMCATGFSVGKNISGGKTSREFRWQVIDNWLMRQFL